jgi:hypothetical protein
MSRIDHRWVSAARGLLNGTGTVLVTLKAPPLVESREMVGQPATQTTPAPAATEHE